MADGESIKLHDLMLDLVRSHYADPEALKLIHGAMRLSSHVIERDPTQFASQLVGRLLPYLGTPAVADFIEGVARTAPRPWLRPLSPTLLPPGTGLLRILPGYGGSINAVAVTSDGQRAVSGSDDNTLTVWDLHSGRELHALAGHAALVNAVAVTSDGQRAVSASDDHTLRVWDLHSGRELHTLAGHADSIRAVVVTT
jgi:WD40 repeat protein